MKSCPACQTCYEDADARCAVSGHPPLVTVREGGLRIGTSYRIERRRDRESEKSVFLGSHVEFDRPAAIRLLAADAIPDGQAAERFLSRARAAARVQHPSLACVYDFGMLPEGGGYVVREAIEGETLRELIDFSGALPIRAAVEIARQLADALAAAHSQGFTHGALVAENIVLTRELGGHSLARAEDFSLRTETSDPREDLRGLGRLLYEMLSGVSEKSPGVGKAAGRPPGAPVPIQSLRPEVPERLGWLVMQSIHENPGLRPKSAAEVSERLRSFENGSEEDASRPPVPKRIPWALEETPSVTEPTSEAGPPPPDPAVMGVRTDVPAAPGGATAGTGRARPVAVYGGIAVAMTLAAVSFWAVTSQTKPSRARRSAPDRVLPSAPNSKPAARPGVASEPTPTVAAPAPRPTVPVPAAVRASMPAEPDARTGLGRISAAATPLERDASGLR